MDWVSHGPLVGRSVGPCSHRDLSGVREKTIAVINRSGNGIFPAAKKAIASLGSTYTRVVYGSNTIHHDQLIKGNE